MIFINDSLLQSKIDPSVIEYDEERTLAISQNCHDLSFNDQNILSYDNENTSFEDLAK